MGGFMRWFIFAIVGLLPLTAGCVATTKAAFTLNKTIELDKRALEGTVVGLKLEWIR